MDLRIYYQKVREMEAKIAEEFPYVISRETPEGGRRGPGPKCHEGSRRR